MPPKVHWLLSKRFFCYSRADQWSEFSERKNWASQANGKTRSSVDKVAAQRLHGARVIWCKNKKYSTLKYFLLNEIRQGGFFGHLRFLSKKYDCPTESRSSCTLFINWLFLVQLNTLFLSILGSLVNRDYDPWDHRRHRSPSWKPHIWSYPKAFEKLRRLPWCRHLRVP